MILLDKKDEVIKVALSTQDMFVQLSVMTITNRQTKREDTLEVFDVSTIERTSIYQFFVFTTPPTNPQPDVTYIDNAVIQDGSYDYKIGSEIGLFQIGRPQLVKTEYNMQENNITYYGE